MHWSNPAPTHLPPARRVTAPPPSRPRHPHPKHQRLSIEIKARRIPIRDFPKIDKSVLGDKVIIAEREEEILCPFPFLASVLLILARLDRHQAQPLPLLIEEALILGATVAEAKLGQLGVDVEVQEGAIARGDDTGLEGAVAVGDGGIGRVVVERALDVGGLADVKDVSMAEERLGGCLAVAGAGVAGQDEELGGVVGEGENLGLGGHFESAVGCSEEGEGDDVFGGVGGLAAAAVELVFEEAGLFAFWVAGASVLR